MVNEPFAEDTTVDLPDVASLVAVTVAPGITPPPVSCTTPWIADVAVDWAKAGALMNAANSAINRTFVQR
jgi:hypothetical protein